MTLDKWNAESLLAGKWSVIALPEGTAAVLLVGDGAIAFDGSGAGYTAGADRNADEGLDLAAGRSASIAIPPRPGGVRIYLAGGDTDTTARVYPASAPVVGRL